MIVVFLGAPGTGKGTQGKIFSQNHGLAHISTGDILRNAVKNQTTLGQKAKGYMDSGQLVPDSLMIDLIAERLNASDCEAGFILDGFPRTLTQAEALDEYLSHQNLTIDKVISLEVDPAALVKRLTSRRLCRNCGKDYNVITNPPPADSRCVACGGEIYQREDDKEATILNRLRVYGEQTQPLANYYQAQGKIRVIDANQDIHLVQQQIERVFATN